MEIESDGAVDCTVKLRLDQIPSWTSFVAATQRSFIPLHVLLPFKVADRSDINIRDDLVWMHLPVEKKYTLLFVLVPRGMDALTVDVGRALMPGQTVEGKSKIEIGFNYNVGDAIKSLLAEPNSVSTYGVDVGTPRRFDDDEVTPDPPAKFVRTSTHDGRRWALAEADMLANGGQLGFVYPNIGREKEKEWLVFLGLVAGLASAFLQFFPIRSRNSKALWVILVLGVLAGVAVFMCYTRLPRDSFMNVVASTSAFLPHGPTALIGLLYLRWTKDQLLTVSGEVRDTDGQPVRFADVIIQKRKQRRNGSVYWATREDIVGEDPSGRFMTRLVNWGASAAYRVRVSKRGYEPRMVEFIPTGKVHELEAPIVLTRIPEGPAAE